MLRSPRFGCLFVRRDDPYGLVRPLYAPDFNTIYSRLHTSNLCSRINFSSVSNDRVELAREGQNRRDRPITIANNSQVKYSVRGKIQNSESYIYIYTPAREVSLNIEKNRSRRQFPFSPNHCVREKRGVCGIDPRKDFDFKGNSRALARACSEFHKGQCVCVAAIYTLRALYTTTSRAT